MADNYNFILTKNYVLDPNLWEELARQHLDTGPLSSYYKALLPFTQGAFWVDHYRFSFLISCLRYFRCYGWISLHSERKYRSGNGWIRKLVVNNYPQMLWGKSKALQKCKGCMSHHVWKPGPVIKYFFVYTYFQFPFKGVSYSFDSK